MYFIVNQYVLDESLLLEKEKIDKIEKAYEETIENVEIPSSMKKEIPVYTEIMASGRNSPTYFRLEATRNEEPQNFSDIYRPDK